MRSWGCWEARSWRSVWCSRPTSSTLDKVQTLNRTLEEKLQALSDQEDALAKKRTQGLANSQGQPIADYRWPSSTPALGLEVNPAWERAFQRVRSEIIGKTPVQLGFWRDEAHREQFKQEFGTAADG